MTTTPASMTPLEVLEESRKYITDPKNWHTSTLGYIDGPVCAVGALSLTVNNAHPDGEIEYLTSYYEDTPQFASARDALETLYEVIPDDHMSKRGRMERIEAGEDSPGWIFSMKEDAVYTFNDNSSHEDVLRLFDEAIKKLKS